MKPLRHRAAGALTLGLAALVFAGLNGGALAQISAEQQSAIRGNCRSDFMSKCSGVTPGGKEALQCLQKNVATLSPGCKTAVSATMPAPAPAPAPPPVVAKPPEPAPAPAAAAPPPPPPAAPAPAAVTNAPPAPAPVAAPKSAPPKPAAAAKPQSPAAAPKQAVVAPAAPAPAPAAVPAQTAPAPSEQQMKAIRFTCRKEFANNCRGVPPNSAEAIACLQRNPSKLTPDCKTSLADLGDAMPAAAGPQVPAATHAPNAPVAMTAVIGRACARDLLLHCRDVKLGDGRKIACLMERGPALAPVCQAALKITAPVR